MYFFSQFLDINIYFQYKNLILERLTPNASGHTPQGRKNASPYIFAFKNIACTYRGIY